MLERERQMTATEKVLADEQAAMEAEETQEYRGYTVADLRKTFNALTDPKDWKGPICAWIPASLFGEASAAVEFFAAASLKITGGPQLLTGRILVESDGYQMGPAGDH